MKEHIFIIVFVLYFTNTLASIYRLSSAGKYQLQLHNLTTSADPAYVVGNFSCTQDTISVDVKLVQQIDRLKLTLVVNAKSGDKAKAEYSNVMNRTIDFCAFLANRSLEPYMNIVIGSYIEALGNRFELKCPLLDQNYSVKDFKVDMSAWPDLLPTMHFEMILIWRSMQNHEYFRARAMGTVRKGRRKQRVRP